MIRATLLLGLLLPPADDPIAPKGDPIRLFNGRDLTGFTTWLGDTKREDPRGVFSVRDGMIRISGDGFGYLATIKPWRDYRLVAEFRWGARNFRGREKNARDSGIFLHGTGPDGNSEDGHGAFMAAIECQVMQGRVGDLMLIRGKGADGTPVPMRLEAEAAPGRDSAGWPTWKKGGEPVTIERYGRINWTGIDPGWKDLLDFRGAGDVESPGSEWTRVECECEGRTIRIRVNGTLVNEARGSLEGGRILLQCEGSEVFFRTLELHPLK